MKNRMAWVMGLLMAAGVRWTFGQTTPLAVELAEEGDPVASALEFRRLALGTNDASARAGYYWLAAFEYYRGTNWARCDSMLDRAENDAPEELRTPALLLRGENAAALRRWDEAAFYLDSALTGAGDEDARILAARRLAAVQLRQKDVPAARAALERSPKRQTQGLAGIQSYETGHDKRPAVGGLLGIIPGLGYAYAGEYGNALRSLILNGLFLFGMYATAEEDQWGGFAVITFFEFTWYSGSIYGGMDASQRYNRRRLESAVAMISGESAFAPDLSQIPMILLKYQF